MTIICSNCGKIPFNYTVIDNKFLCLKCNNEKYKKELEELKKRFGK